MKKTQIKISIHKSSFEIVSVMLQFFKPQIILTIRCMMVARFTTFMWTMLAWDKSSRCFTSWSGWWAWVLAAWQASWLIHKWYPRVPITFNVEHAMKIWDAQNDRMQKWKHLLILWRIEKKEKNDNRAHCLNYLSKIILIKSKFRFQGGAGFRGRLLVFRSGTKSNKNQINDKINWKTW